MLLALVALMVLAQCAGKTMVLTRDAIAVTASSRGNLGAPAVVVQESVDDWLKDRWQATPTGNMQGKPLPLPQWLRVELAHPVTFIESAVVDFETAFADAYTIEVASQPGGPWETVAKVSPDTGPTAVHRLPDQKHVVHTVDIRASAGELSTNPITFARLSLTHAGTGWGVSVWRFELHGS